MKWLARSRRVRLSEREKGAGNVGCNDDAALVRRSGPRTISLQEWYTLVTESYSFEHIFLHPSSIFSLKYEIDRAQRDLSIAHTNVRIGWH